MECIPCLTSDTDRFSNEEAEGASDEEEKEQERNEDKGEAGEFAELRKASLV